MPVYRVRNGSRISAAPGAVVTASRALVRLWRAGDRLRLGTPRLGRNLAVGAYLSAERSVRTTR